jgi:hypothetical protein
MPYMPEDSQNAATTRTASPRVTPFDPAAAVAPPQSKSSAFFEALQGIGHAVSGIGATFQGRPYDFNAVNDVKLRQQMAQQEMDHRKRKLQIDEEENSRRAQSDFYTGLFKASELAKSIAGPDNKKANSVFQAVLSMNPQYANHVKDGGPLSTLSISPEQGGSMDHTDHNAAKAPFWDPIQKKMITEGLFDIKNMVQGTDDQGNPVLTIGDKGGYGEAASAVKARDQAKRDKDAADRDAKRDADAEARELEREKRAAEREDRRDLRQLKSQAHQNQLAAKNQAEIAARQDKSIAAIMNKPADASTQKDVAELYGVLRQVDNIKTNFDKEYLGPIKGTDTAFDARRKIGSYVGSPVGKKELVFRQALKDVGDQLLRARTGAAMSIPEYDRMVGLLPKASDEEKVFNAGMERFEAEMKALLDSRVELSRTPRKDMSGAGSAATKGIGGGSSTGTATHKFNPATGKIEAVK